jgi:hypothetical protein
MGGTEDFGPAIVRDIVTINAAAFVGLLVLNRLGAVGGLGGRPGLELAAAERHSSFAGLSALLPC